MKKTFLLILVPLMICGLTPSALAETAPEANEQPEPAKEGAAEPPAVEKLSLEDQYLLNIAKGSFFTFSAFQMPLHVYVRPTNLNVSSELNRAMQSAFSQWSDATDKRVTFQFLKTDSNPEITVVWTKNPAELKDGAQGYTSFKMVNERQKAQILLLFVERSDGRPLPPAGIKALTLHEIGHALGLAHSKDAADIMGMEKLTEKSHISQRDLRLFKKIYASKREDLLREHIPLMEKAYGSDSVIVASYLSKLGRLLNIKKQFAAAEPYLERALAIEDKSLPVAQDDHISTLRAAANVYMHLGKYDKAEPYFDRLLKLKRSGSQFNVTEEQILRDTLKCQEEQKESEKIFATLTELDEFYQKTKPKCEDRAWVLGKMGYIEFNKGDKDKARPLFKTACEIYSNTPPSKFRSWCLDFYKSQFNQAK